MELRPHINSLQGRTVTLPGGQDKEGHSILLVNIPPECPHLDIAPALQYSISIFSETSRLKGITVIIDAHKGPWKVAKACIRQTTSTFSAQELAYLIVLRPDVFWDKQRVENCTSGQNEGQVTIIPRNRLNKFVDQSQLPTELGGWFIYNHELWLENRRQAEEFFNDAEVTLNELQNLHEYLISNQKLRASEISHAHNTSLDMSDSTKMLVHNALEEGRELMQKIEYENRTRKFASESDSMSTPQDVLDTLQKIENFISEIRKKQFEIEAAWTAMEKSFEDAKDLSLLEDGVVKVTNWILGPAEHLLNSKQKVGYDVTSAEQLRREHEEIELLCRDTYGAYAELLHKIDNFSKNEITSVQHKDLLFQKDFMDFVCRSFATRLERRRNILITSLRFFRLVSEYFDRTGEVFDSLVMGNKVGNFAKARQQLRELQESQSNLDAVERELAKEGEKLSDMLSMPIKDALGREIAVDYTEDIINIRDILDATTARKNIFSDSVELQKLTLEQVILTDEYETDVEQAVRWLDELFHVMLRDHGHVGCSVFEIQSQKEEHQAFQETAKASYNYGCQLLNASLALRQSCKLTLDEHTALTQKLNHSWQRLLDVSQEQMTRLRVSAVFHRSVEEQCNQMRDLREAVATMPLMEICKKRARVKFYMGAREKLLVEVGRMVRLGRLLKSRLKDPLYVDDAMSNPSTIGSNAADMETSDQTTSDNAIAIEAITERLSEVTGLAEELDQALQSAQQDCIFPTVSTSSTSTIPRIVTTSALSKKVIDGTSNAEDATKPTKPEDLKSDEEFLTASDGTLQHSRSSSYNTASECENRYSPWWEFDKNINENLAKEKMVLAVGLPELPPAQSVLKPSPEVPPGKIVREVTETTHLKVQHSCNLGVSSYVLTSETVRDKRDGIGGREGAVGIKGERTAYAVDKSQDKAVVDENLLKRLKEVGGSEEEAWKNYRSATKQTIKSFL